MKMITELQQHEVFVFGSNDGGWHGAGAAGFACRGVAANNWRLDPWFLAAAQSASDSEQRIGKWAVLGQGRGFQVGREGKSYAIATVEKPGDQRTIGLMEIGSQLIDLSRFASDYEEWEFLITPLGTGFAGYTHEEMQRMWDIIKADGWVLPNMRLLWEEN